MGGVFESLKHSRGLLLSLLVSRQLGSSSRAAIDAVSTEQDFGSRGQMAPIRPCANSTATAHNAQTRPNWAHLGISSLGPVAQLAAEGGSTTQHRGWIRVDLLAMSCTPEPYLTK